MAGPVQFGNVTATQFREDFPEFSDQSFYPPSTINYLINLASLLFNQDRWDSTPGVTGLSVMDAGVELFIAHNLVLEKMATDAANDGGDPGLSEGPVAGKSVGPVSVNYATGEALEVGAGHWNLTTYGTRLKRLMSYFGAGPVQLNIGIAPPFVSGAWQGPLPWPLPSGTGFSS